MKECKATPEMQKFFEKLLSLKKDVKAKADKTNNPDLVEIYNKLHQIIKQEGECHA